MSIITPKAYSICTHHIDLRIHVRAYSFRLRNTSLEPYYCAFLRQHIVIAKRERPCCHNVYS